MNEIVDALRLAKRIVMHQARWALLKPPLGHLALVRTRVHRSDVMFSVLVVVLCRNRIAIFELQCGPAPNIAHSFISCSESPSAQVGMKSISDDSAGGHPR